MNTLNFNDISKLNNILRNNMNERVVEQGQTAIAGIVYNKYLKDEQGNLLYRCIDAARQNFQYVDEGGNMVTDIGAKILTNAVASSDMSNQTARIAENMKDLYTNNEKFNSVMSLTTEFEKDNSTFRKEIVFLSKKDQKEPIKK